MEFVSCKQNKVAADKAVKVQHAPKATCEEAASSSKLSTNNGPRPRPQNVAPIALRRAFLEIHVIRNVPSIKAKSRDRDDGVLKSAAHLIKS